MDDHAEECMRVQAQMEDRRGIFEGHWREVAELVRPNQNIFNQSIRAEGDKRSQRIFDDTAQLALPKFAAAVISMAFPATQQYHKITSSDEKIADKPAVKRYYEQVNNLLFRVRYGPHANFQSQSGEVVLDVGAFGTGILFTDDVLGIGIRYKSFPLGESYIDEDAHGRVDRLHRKFELTAYQACSLFDPARLSEGIRTAKEKTPLQKFTFLHSVYPNPEFNQRQMLHPVNGKRFASRYIEFDKRSCVSEGGYRTFPFAVPRFETAPREVYGRGPAMKVLATIKTLNEKAKTIIRAGQMVVAPPLMLTDDASLAAFDMRSNALNHGYVNGDGRALAIPLITGGKVDIGLDLMNADREAINDAFFVTLFRILVEEPRITATEAMLRAQEKGQLLAPTMGRMQAELLGVQVERELDILAMNGSLPPMPQELIDSGAEYKLVFQSPLNQAQKAGVGIAILNTWQAIAPIAQLDKSVMTLFDTHEAARLLADSNGYPASALRTEEEATALAEQQAQSAQMQQLLAAAPVAAGAVKDLAQASAMAGGSPGGQAPNLGLAP